MKVISLHEINVPDNLNHAPNVVPFPEALFDGVLSHDQHEDWLDAFKDPDAFNEAHDRSG